MEAASWFLDQLGKEAASWFLDQLGKEAASWFLDQLAMEAASWFSCVFKFFIIIRAVLLMPVALVPHEACPVMDSVQ